MPSQTSIYTRPTLAAVVRTPEARAARRRRREARLDAVRAPTSRLDRLGPVRDLLRAFREGRPDASLAAYLATVRADVEALEAWAASRTKDQRRSRDAVRQALDLLRTFGRMTALDFSSVPIEERGHLVALLAWEHRWCYAAAGTSRACFKAATGRTGAR